MSTGAHLRFFPNYIIRMIRNQKLFVNVPTWFQHIITISLCLFNIVANFENTVKGSQYNLNGILLL